MGSIAKERSVDPTMPSRRVWFLQNQPEDTLGRARSHASYARGSRQYRTPRSWSELTSVLAEESARAALELVKRALDRGLRKPGLGDAIVLATVRICRASVLTCNPHFKGLPETLWLSE